jgi:NitT/TauT family transport system permease protein
MWAVGWSTVIAAEMLGVSSGLGFRLLDFRYLLAYPQMLFYMLVIGLIGVVSDLAFKKLQTRYSLR